MDKTEDAVLLKMEVSFLGMRPRLCSTSNSRNRQTRKLILKNQFQLMVLAHNRVTLRNT